MVFFQEINIFAVTNVMKTKVFISTTLVWKTVCFPISTDINGTEISAIILAHTGGISTGMVHVCLIVTILCLLSTEMANIIVSILHLLELDNTFIITEQSMKVVFLL